MARNPYDVLGVSVQATPDEIKKAYRDLVKKYHPDHYKDHPLEDLAKEKMQEVNEAYRILTQGNRPDGPPPGESPPGSQSAWNQRPPHQSWHQPGQSPYYRQRESVGVELCNALSCLCCADACCSCFGGDLCGC